MLIITGTGRCGTETLARLFGGHHEFRASYLIDKYLSKADPRSGPFDTMEKRLEAVLDLHQGIDSGAFVDSSNLYIHLIDAVHAVCPSAKFVLCVRNGKDFARSALSRKWHERLSFGMVPPANDPYSGRWEEMSPLQRCAWIWAYRNAKALQGLSGVPGEQKFIVGIEDIGRLDVLDSLESFSGRKLPGRDSARKKHNANPFFELPPKEEWTEEMNREFDEIAEGMMRLLGYC